MSTVDPKIRANNRAIGQSVENALDRLVHPSYARSGLAILWHEGTRAIPTRRGWQPVDSRPDYSGLLMGSGRAITFDAKHCAGNRYRHPKERLHQLQDIWDVHEAGGIGGILVVNWSVEAAWWLLPQPEWANAEFTSTLLARYSDAALEVPYLIGMSEFLPDWLRTEGLL